MFIRAPKGYRRNEVSPFRALTHWVGAELDGNLAHRRNEVSPFRALTQTLQST